MIAVTTIPLLTAFNKSLMRFRFLTGFLHTIGIYRIRQLPVPSLFGSIQAAPADRSQEPMLGRHRFAAASEMVLDRLQKGSLVRLSRGQFQHRLHYAGEQFVLP